MYGLSWSASLYSELRLIRKFSRHSSSTTVWLTKLSHQALVRPGRTQNHRGRGCLLSLFNCFWRPVRSSDNARSFRMSDRCFIYLVRTVKIAKVTWTQATMFETSARRTATSPRFSAILVNGSLLLRDWTLLPTSSYSKVSGVGRPHGIGFVAYLFFFHSGERIQKVPDSLPNSPYPCGRKPCPERKSCGFKKIRIRVDGALNEGKTITTSELSKTNRLNQLFRYFVREIEICK